jgi:hypothetical protein
MSGCTINADGLLAEVDWPPCWQHPSRLTPINAALAPVLTRTTRPVPTAELRFADI